MSASWSHSKLVDFEKCKKMFWLKHIEKIPEPERPLPPGKTEHANDRGSRVHESCEDYVRGKVDQLAPEAELYFGPQIDLLRTMYKDGVVALEGDWGYGADWEIWDWRGQMVEVDDPAELDLPVVKAKALPERPLVDVIYAIGQGRGKPALHYMWTPPWLRMKLDAIVFHDETTATLIDYKTGRKFGNEIKHAEQVQMYQLGAFMRFPKLQTVYSELWYLDQDEVSSQKFNRVGGLRFRDKFTKRGDLLVNCDDFPANPNKFSCKWCQYGPWNGGQCQVGVR